MSKQSRLIVDGFLSMVRKKNLQVYATTQYASKVDCRFRDERDYAYRSQRYANFNDGKGFILIKHPKRLDSKVKVKIKIKVIDMVDKRSIDFDFDANPIYSLYDDKQIVKVEGIEI